MSNDAWHKARVEAIFDTFAGYFDSESQLQSLSEKALKAADFVPVPGEDELMRKLRSAIGSAMDDIAAQESEMDIGYIANMK